MHLRESKIHCESEKFYLIFVRSKKFRSQIMYVSLRSSFESHFQDIKHLAVFGLSTVKAEPQK